MLNNLLRNFFSLANHKSLFLIISRTLFLSIIILWLDYLVKIPTTNFTLISGIFFGSLLGDYLNRVKVRLRGLVIIHLFLFGIYFLLRSVLLSLVSDIEFILSIYTLSLHQISFLTVFSFCSLSYFLTVNYRHYASLESVVLLTGLVSSFSLHRNYRFDLIKSLNDLAWELGYSPLLTLVVIASGSVAIIIAYFFSISQLRPTKKLKQEDQHQTIVSSKATKLRNFGVFTLILLIVVLVSSYVYQSIKIEAQVAAQNGVGSATEEGVSPLNFDSAIGGSNQPAAVVRLEEDYFNNPFEPMMYLRESALSKLNENAFVLASDKYDPDISRTGTSETFIRKQSLSDYGRIPVKHSVYLIGSHDVAFTLDYPIEIRPIKLTAEQKNFKAGYQAVSLAPVYQLEDLSSDKIGNSDWDESTWEHYLEEHSDTRYRDMAAEITQGISGSDKIALAERIIEYLNKNAIYTLSPNHERSKDDDPTAKFLFGDLRGYCVHFSHAVVYMFRSLGIPARIGTGYLTDFSQAKDGHILLRMSDRHAWPELYVEPYGWIPFDVTPEQVESHADTPVDQGMLDDLIDQITADPELLEEDPDADEIFQEDKQSSLLKPITAKKIKLFVLLLIILIYSRKAYLLLMPVISANKRGLRVYVAQLAILTDLNLAKNAGETKLDYYQRIKQKLPAINTELVYDLNKAIYSKTNSEESASGEHHKTNYREFLQGLSNLQKILVIINPKSVISGVGLWK